jgi:hypothetical protein
MYGSKSKDWNNLHDIHRISLNKIANISEQYFQLYHSESKLHLDDDDDGVRFNSACPLTQQSIILIQPGYKERKTHTTKPKATYQLQIYINRKTFK